MVAVIQETHGVPVARASAEGKGGGLVMASHSERSATGGESSTGPARSAARPRILLAAGGTGGHIYPAVALSEALRELAPEAEVQFCCGSRPAEHEIYRRLGLEPWSLPITFKRRGLRRRGRFLREMWASWREARRRLRERPVDVAVGFGSYLSVPPLLAARLSGARLVLHEQNVKPGAANRFLSAFAKLVATAGPLENHAFPPGRSREVGNPVRADLLGTVDRARARAHFQLDADRLVCLCMGGSQGALGLNRIMIEMLRRAKDSPDAGRRWQLLWSTGSAHHDQVLRGLEEAGIDPAGHVIRPYIDEMALAYGAADLVLARAGALTLAELSALGKPAVLVPLPTATGGHQAINARRRVRAGAAEMIEEADPRAADDLLALLERWRRGPGELRDMGEASRRLGRPRAAHDLAKLILDLAPNPRRAEAVN